MIRGGPCAALAALCLVLAVPATAGDLSKIPGRWLEQPPGFGLEATGPVPAGVTPAQVAQVYSRLASAESIFRAVPILRSPRGFSILPMRSVVFGNPGYRSGSEASMPLPGRFDGRMILHWVDSTGAVHTDGGSPGESFRFDLNQPADVFADAASPQFEDSIGPIFLEPRVIREEHGFPRFESGFVALSRSRRPLLAPVSVERVLRIGLSQAQRDLEELRRNAERPGWLATQLQDSMAAPTRRRASRLMARLAALSAGERAAPAWFNAASTDPDAPLGPAGAPGCRALVEVNPAFFDSTLPAGEMQLLTLRVECGDPGCEPFQPLFARLRAELDLAALLRLVK